MRATEKHVLQVDRQEFLDGLRLTKRCKSLGAGVVSFADGMLKVQFREFHFKARASGCWYGEATIPATFFKTLAKSPPYGENPLQIVYEQGNVTIGKADTNCKWKAVTPRTIELRANASLAEILTLSIRHSPEHIAESGLTETVAWAIQRRDELLAKAAAILEPLGIRQADLRGWLAASLEQRTGG